MPDTACKLCLVGEPGVGKTALLRRLAPGAVPAARGITLAPCDLGDDGRAVLWDVAGSSALDSLNQAFLSRVDGILAVADAARPSSAATALRLIAQIRRLYPGTPAALLLNKRDTVDGVPVHREPAAGVDVHETSALRGEEAREAVAALARRARRRRAARA